MGSDRATQAPEFLTLELRRREERVHWAERMNKRGYLSKASLVHEFGQLKEAQAEILRLRGTAVRP